MNVLALISHFENPGLIPRAVAILAGQLHIGQKLHLHRDRAIPFARVASAAWNIEREMSRRKRKPLGLRLRRKQFAHQVESLDVGNGIRAWRPPNRRLIHQHNVIQSLNAGQRGKQPRWICAVALPQRPRDCPIQNLVHQRGFA